METTEETRTPEAALADCAGFEVHGPTGRIGVVEAVRLERASSRPALLSVRAGLLGSWLVHVPVGEVAHVSPREEKIVLRAGGLLAGPRVPGAGTRAA